jgi:NhaP-type Na+/H+ or K+/H+ antiporter
VTGFELSLEMGLGLVLLAVGLYSLVAGWLARRSISAAFAFVAIGALMGGAGIGVMSDELPGSSALGLLTEVTLALVLFSAASTLRIRQVEHDSPAVLRLLAVGLPLSIVAGTALALGLFPGISIGLALIIGAVLAPTDADLGHQVISDPSVPARIRRILNVESGLNDGIAAPVVTVAIAIATVADLSGSNPILEAMGELIVAAIVGIVVGGAGRWLLSRVDIRDTTSPSARKLFVLSLALGAFFITAGLGASGFIAAFVAGMTFGVGDKKQVEEAVSFTEAQSILLSIGVWLIFGLVLVEEHVLAEFDAVVVLYAMLSLTVVRMIPVALSLLGDGFDRVTLLFMGWFGPRGLASIVFALLALDALEAAGVDAGPLLPIVSWTVLLSIILHGFSAIPIAAWYGRYMEHLPDYSPEFVGDQEPRMRGSMLSIDTQGDEPESRVD